MAHGRPELRCDFYTNSRFRLSAFCEHAQQCNLTSHADSAHVLDRDDELPQLKHGSYRYSERPVADCFETKPSRGSSSVASERKPIGVQPNVWRPSFIRVGPLFGLLALLLAFLQIFASFAVLKSSDGHAVSGWKFTPSVYIAILTTFSNGAIQFALTQGAVITFWLRMLSGTTLAQLHRDFSYGTEVYNALRSGKHVSVLAIACIFATLVCLDGVFLQRASSTQSTSHHRHVNLSISVVPEVPSYFTGSYDPSGPQATFSDAMIPILNEYSSRTPITGGIQGCSGTCTTTIRAPALIAYKCTSNTTWQNFSTPYTPEEMKVLNGNHMPDSRKILDFSLTASYGPVETLDFYTYLNGDAIAETCAGPINSTHCYLRSAVAEYDISVTNGTISLQDPGNPRLISWANNTAITKKTIDEFALRQSTNSTETTTTLGGLVNAFLMQYAFYGSADPPEIPGYLQLALMSQPWFLYEQTANYEQYSKQKACTYAWKDPRSAAMAGLNELMFRIGVHVAKTYDHASLEDRLDPGVQTNYTVGGILHSPVEVFQSDFIFFFAAAAVELLTIMLVLSTFYGYWRLGRHVSFSPLEIAKAFGAALLTRVSSNLSGEEIAEEDESEIQYGMIYNDKEPVESTRRQGMLTISHRESVEAPEDGSVCV